MVRRAVPAVLLVVATLMVGAGVRGLGEVNADLVKADRRPQVSRALADRCDREHRHHPQQQRVQQDS